MDKQNQLDQKYRSQYRNEDDDEQIQKTLNFFDSILDQYLYDQDVTDENKSKKIKIYSIKFYFNRSSVVQSSG
jgi:hypothetical protein